MNNNNNNIVFKFLNVKILIYAEFGHSDTKMAHYMENVKYSSVVC